MLTDTENKLHEEDLKCAGQFVRGQNNLIRLLIRVERSRYYRKMNRRNLMEFIQRSLHIDSTYTYELVRVTEKALEFPIMAEALMTDRLMIGQAGRIVSKINPDNAAELVEYAWGVS